MQGRRGVLLGRLHSHKGDLRHLASWRKSDASPWGATGVQVTVTLRAQKLHLIPEDIRLGSFIFLSSVKDSSPDFSEFKSQTASLPSSPFRCVRCQFFCFLTCKIWTVMAHTQEKGNERGRPWEQPALARLYRRREVSQLWLGSWEAHTKKAQLEH